MPYEFITRALPAHAWMSVHSADDSGADPTNTRWSVPICGGLAMRSASRHSAGTDDMKVIWCSSMMLPMRAVVSGRNGGMM